MAYHLHVKAMLFWALSIGLMINLVFKVSSSFMASVLVIRGSLQGVNLPISLRWSNLFLQYSTSTAMAGSKVVSAKRVFFDQSEMLSFISDVKRLRTFSMVILGTVLKLGPYPKSFLRSSFLMIDRSPDMI